MTTRMRAISQRAVGGPEVLEDVEVDRPEPGPGEVLVRVAAAGVNPADWKLRAGLVDRIGPPPFTLGLDVSGTVEESDSEAFRPGDEVHGLVLSRSGAYADYVVLPGSSLAPKPHLDHVRAAALPSAGLTAWQGLSIVEDGRRVLVHAAAGGVGHLAVQIAKAKGAHVIGTARAVNHEFLRGLGADELIDYTEVDFSEAVADVDLVLDLVGGDCVPRSLGVLGAGGRVVDAVTWEPDFDDPRYRRMYVEPSGADLRRLGELVRQGRLRVEVSEVLPLNAEGAAKAHELSQAGRVRGKIVLVP